MNVRELICTNTPERFWRLSRKVPEAVWEAASESAQSGLNWSFQTPISTEAFLEATLGEGQFGPERYVLSRAKTTYYSIVRPILPARLRPMLRAIWRRQARRKFPLGWPIEDRIVRFQREVLREVLRVTGIDACEMEWFWPNKAQFALGLTHDVEAQAGHDFVPTVMELEERLNFRSSFNFVPADYHVDPDLLQELRRRGFEVGVHGYRHDGRLFLSRRRFEETAPRINQIARRWGTTGFRSPLTHRHPEWMQALEIDYDSSYFDTDPFEPMPGGTMSIWPFLLGRFVELPYTLPQDHTLFEMGERSSRMWREKVGFIEEHHGLALVNVHPDYLRARVNLAVYEEFLNWLNENRTFWHALPRDIAARWRLRSLGDTSPAPGEVVRVELSGGRISFALS